MIYIPVANFGTHPLGNAGPDELIISVLGYTWENDTADLIDENDEHKIISMDIQDTPTAERNGSVPLDNDDEDVINSTFDSRVQLELNDDTGDLFLLY